MLRSRLKRKKLLTAMIPVSTGHLGIIKIVTYYRLLDLKFQYAIFKLSCVERNGATAKIQVTF